MTQTTLGFSSQLDLLVIPCLFLIGRVNTNRQFFEPMSPTKAKTKDIDIISLDCYFKAALIQVSNHSD